MSTHLFMFIFEEVSVFTDNLFKILVSHKIIEFGPNNEKMVGIILNMIAVFAGTLVNGYIGYLMYLLSNPEGIEKSKCLFVYLRQIIRGP